MSIDYSKEIFVFVLAGGKGERLSPLTRDRAKPAVPFGGKFRIIDFTMSNCVNSGFRKIAVVTQYKSASLRRHLALAWDFLSSRFNEYVLDLPPQQIIGERWYLGTADAIFQNLYFLEQEKPKYVVILSGDHIYKMDYRKILTFHEANGADVTVSSLVVDRDLASSFGVIEIMPNNRIVSFKEKPKVPPAVPDNSEKSLVSMGVYIFNSEALKQLLIHDFEISTSSHDFGHDILPYALSSGMKLFAYRFVDEEGKQVYWRDVGSIDAFYEANMDLLSSNPRFDLYDRTWPFYTHSRQLPPAKVTSGSLDGETIKSNVENSIIGEGSIVSGASIANSVVFYNVKIKTSAKIEDSILFPEVRIGRNVKIRRCIIDKEVVIPEGITIGYDILKDKKFFYVSPKGVTVIPKNYKFGGLE